MPKFLVECSWEVRGEYIVEADTLEQAISKVEEGKPPFDDLPEGEYVDDTFGVSKDGSHVVPNSWQKDKV